MSVNFQNIRECLQYISGQITGTYPEEEAKSIAYLILEETFSVSKTELLKKLDLTLTSSQTDKIKDIVFELKKEKPVQYLLGKCSFYDCSILVKPGILIPRPETEELVQWVIEDLKDKINKFIDDRELISKLTKIKTPVRSIQQDVREITEIYYKLLKKSR